MASVTLETLRRVFPDGTVGLHGLSLDIADGEFLTFLGPSGSGKTTTLRMIAGLEHPTSGVIRFGARRVETLSPADRNVAMVFQNYALYPHMTVRRNLEYPLRKRRVPAAERETRIAEVTALLQIGALLDRRPRQLSGGQQQRVALGRAMVRPSDVFLLDEPLSNLDAELRAHMRAELIQLHRTLNRTMIYVTHDQMEAMTMSSRIAVLSQGRLQQAATPHEIYHAPANRFVATFVGSPAMNMLAGSLEQRGDFLCFVSPHITIPLPARRRAELQGAPAAVIAGIRPDDLRFTGGDGEARVSVVERAGHEAVVWLTLGAQRLVARAPADTRAQAGDHGTLCVEGGKVHLFGAEDQARLIGPCPA
ncbi:MAG: ABC transporter ATP-binding protein [Acidisphaera sp.]|nr:ABC transporter ATP-binding protein [Acidisphaera sp.]